MGLGCFDIYYYYYYYYYYYDDDDDDDDDDDVESSTEFTLGRNIQSSLIPRPQTSNPFLRICDNPKSANVCIVLVWSSVLSCLKWPASFFDFELNEPTATGTTSVFDFQILLISLARSWYFSYFSDSFCSILLSPGTATVMSTMIVSFAFLLLNYNVWPPVVDFMVC